MSLPTAIGASAGLKHWHDAIRDNDEPMTPLVASLMMENASLRSDNERLRGEMQLAYAQIRGKHQKPAAALARLWAASRAPKQELLD